MADPTEIFTLTTDAVAAIVDTEPEPRSQTPCPDWNYAQLLGHLVGGDRLFFGILTGAVTPAGPPRLAPGTDQPAPTPADYREASGRLARVLADPAVQAGVHQVPVGQLSGNEITILRSVEHLLHGWDLAVAGGASTRSLQPSATALAEPARRLLAAVGDSFLVERRPFGASVEVAAGATDLDQLIAAFGRDPAWRPDPVAAYARIKE